MRSWEPMLIELATTLPSASPSRPATIRVTVSDDVAEVDRVCVPSPWISSGSPARAAWTKRGITIPYWPLCRAADGVEEPCDDAVEAALLVPGEREELVDRLRVGVRPAAGVVGP